MKNPVASYRISKSKELCSLLSFPLVGNPSSERFWTSQNDYKKERCPCSKNYYIRGKTLSALWFYGKFIQFGIQST